MTTTHERTTVNSKPTHIDRLLDESSYNPTSHKATTNRTLTRRAQQQRPTRRSTLAGFFWKNNYNDDFIQHNTYRPTTTTKADDNATPTTTVTIPYIKGISENISCIVQPFNIRIAHNPITTLHQLWLTSKTKTNRGTEKEQYIRSIASTATPPTTARLVETSQLDWLNTNERWGKAMSTITLLNITDLRITLLTRTLRNA